LQQRWPVRLRPSARVRHRNQIVRQYVNEAAARVVDIGDE
jgi:hypothetical protein